MSVLDRLRALLAGISAVRLAAAFGSVARGEERPGSDLDLALLLDPDTPPAASRSRPRWDGPPDVRSISFSSTPRRRSCASRSPATASS
jgi:hypothetical protein